MSGASIWVRVLQVLAALAVVMLMLVWITIPAGEIDRRHPCLSNIKQISLGMLMYVGDWDGRYPSALSWIDAEMPYVKPEMPYVRNEDLFTCPAVRLRKQRYGYAFNSLLDHANSAGVDQEKTPMIYDSSSLWRNATDPVASVPVPGRHKEGDRVFNNIGYADGHARGIYTGPR